MKKKSTKKNQIVKIASDVTWTISEWTLGYLLVLFVIYIGSLFFLTYIGMSNQSFLVFTYPSSHFYMIVVGVSTAIYFMPTYVKLGVTRKNAFLGTVGGVFSSSLLLILATVVITFIVQGIISIFSISLEWESSLFNTIMGVSEQIPAQEYQALFGDSLLAVINRGLITFLTYWVSLALHISVGWLMSTGFYTGGFLRGILTVLGGLIIISVNQVFWGEAIMSILPQFSFFSENFLNWLLGFVVAIALTIFALAMTRNLTRRMTIML